MAGSSGDQRIRLLPIVFDLFGKSWQKIGSSDRAQLLRYSLGKVRLGMPYIAHQWIWTGIRDTTRPLLLQE